jgi:hypothetical protein
MFEFGIVIMKASSQQNLNPSGQTDDAVKTDGQVLRAVWRYSWVGLIFWAVWALVALMMACRFAGSGTIATAGQIGDLFGGINALFTGLSLAALVYTIILQNKQIKSQDDHNRKSFEELVISKNTQSIIELRNVLQEEETRRARAKVLNNEETDPSQWTQEEIDAAERVCHTYEFAGVLAKNKLITADLIYETWEGSIEKCWGKLERFLREDHRGYKLKYDQFRILAERYQVWKNGINEF